MVYFRYLPVLFSRRSCWRIGLKKLIIDTICGLITSAKRLPAGRQGYLHQMSTGHLITPRRDYVAIMEEVDYCLVLIHVVVCPKKED